MEVEDIAVLADKGIEHSEVDPCCFPFCSADLVKALGTVEAMEYLGELLGSCSKLAGSLSAAVSGGP